LSHAFPPTDTHILTFGINATPIDKTWKAVHVKGNTGARSCKNYCCGKAIKYCIFWECVCSLR
jgi:hypothetical protein